MNPKNPLTPSMTAEKMSDTLSDTKSAITQTAREATSKVKSSASSTMSRAREEAERAVRERKEKAAAQIGSYSSAIHESARSFEEKDPNIAWFTHRAADRLQSVADYMRDRDFSGLRDDVADMARRHPGAFFGGMFLAGLVLGNFVKASQKPRWDDDDDDYRQPEMDWTAEDETAAAQTDLPMSSTPIPSSSGGI